MAEIQSPSLLRFKTELPYYAKDAQGQRVSAKDAGYMELNAAIKDAECSKVKVEGGVSSELGCCNLYQPQAIGTNSFKCGVCEYLELK